MCVISRMSRESLRLRSSASSTVSLRLVHDEFAPRRILERIRDREDVLVTATGLIDQNHSIARQLRRFLERLRKRVRRLERGNDAFFANRERERIDDFAIRR